MKFIKNIILLSAFLFPFLTCTAEGNSTTNDQLNESVSLNQAVSFSVISSIINPLLINSFRNGNDESNNNTSFHPNPEKIHSPQIMKSSTVQQKHNDLTSLVKKFKKGLSVWNLRSDVSTPTPVVQGTDNFKMNLLIGATNNGAGLKLTF